jgi:translocation protein SEC63
MPLATTNPLCRSLFIILGWVVFSLLAYRVATTKIDIKIYDPFEILGIKSVSLGCQMALATGCRPPSTQCPCCTIHSYITFIHRVLRKRTSSLTTKSSPKHSEYFTFSSFTHCLAHYPHSHPDKVKLTGNDTAESVAGRFVEITKAYKAYATIHEIYLV